MDPYEAKYLKYKEKYLSLKKEIFGGEPREDNDSEENEAPTKQPVEIEEPEESQFADVQSKIVDLKEFFSNNIQKYDKNEEDSFEKTKDQIGLKAAKAREKQNKQLLENKKEEIKGKNISDLVGDNFKIVLQIAERKLQEAKAKTEANNRDRNQRQGQGQGQINQNLSADDLRNVSIAYENVLRVKQQNELYKLQMEIKRAIRLMELMQQSKTYLPNIIKSATSTKALEILKTQKQKLEDIKDKRFDSDSDK